MVRVRTGIVRSGLVAFAAVVPVLVAPVGAGGGPAGRTAPAAPETPTVATDPGPVTGWSTAPGTDGRTYFADAQGRALHFRGFGNKTDDPAGLFTDELLAAGAARGFNLLRLSYWWDELEPTEGTWNESYLDAMVTVLDRAEAHGYHVILASHQDVFGPAFGHRGIPAWATRTDGVPFVPQPSWLLDYLQPAVQNAFEHLYEDADLRAFQIRAWMKVVERVQDHPALFGYDLMNEPFGKIREGEDLISAAGRVEREQLTPMYQRLTDAIAAVDPDHWVFIEPPNLNSLGIATSLGEVVGPKVAIMPHMYDPNIEGATYSPGRPVEYDAGFFDRWAAAVTSYPERHGIPMLVGEWGTALSHLPGMEAFLRDSLLTLEETTSGWTMWAACFGEGYCPFDAEGGDRPGIDEIVAPYPRAVAGAMTSSHWDPLARTLQVRYLDSTATGATDLYVPVEKRYPEGWEVRTSAPDGSWTSTFDEATGALSVTIEPTGGDQAICVVPAGWQGECLAVDPEVPEPPVDPGPEPTPPPAQPVPGSASYTG